MRVITTAIAASALCTTAVSADIINVQMTGWVEWNQVSFGLFGTVNVNDDVAISFDVDSTNYVDSPNFPTRGYEIIQSSFALTMGSVSVGLQDPFPAGQTPYFVLRNDDPAVDGFFIGTNIDVPFGGLPVNEPAQLADFFTANFDVSYGNDPLPSLDILDAVGHYDYDGLTRYYFTVNDDWAEPIGIWFTDMTITPAPGSLSLLGLGALAIRRRR